MTDDVSDLWDDADLDLIFGSPPPPVRTLMDVMAGKSAGSIVSWLGQQFVKLTNTSFQDTGRKDDEHRKQLAMMLSRPMKLVGPSSSHQVHEWIAGVHGRSPWMGPVSRHVMSQVEALVRAGVRATSWDPILVYGEPGIGKTHYAADLAKSAGVPVLMLDGSSMTSSFQVAGMERGWANASASPVIRMIAETGVANPVVVLDEVDKVAHGSRAGDAHHALLGMIEKLSARSWRCPFTELVLDISRVSWVFTANDIGAVSAPLRDRCRVIRANAPSESDIRGFVERRLAGQDPEIIKQAVRAVSGRSLRVATRVTEAVVFAGKKHVLN